MLVVEVVVVLLVSKWGDCWRVARVEGKLSLEVEGNLGTKIEGSFTWKQKQQLKGS